MSTLENLDDQYVETLKSLLSQCTEKQQKFFTRMYPMGIDEMENHQVRRAIEQCEATIRKNEK